LLGKERFAGVDIRVRVKGGGRVSQIYGMSLAAGVWVYMDRKREVQTAELGQLFGLEPVSSINSPYKHCLMGLSRQQQLSS